MCWLSFNTKDAAKTVVDSERLDVYDNEPQTTVDIATPGTSTSTTQAASVPKVAAREGSPPVTMYIVIIVVLAVLLVTVAACGCAVVLRLRWNGGTSAPSTNNANASTDKQNEPTPPTVHFRKRVQSPEQTYEYPSQGEENPDHIYDRPTTSCIPSGDHDPGYIQVVHDEDSDGYLTANPKRTSMNNTDESFVKSVYKTKNTNAVCRLASADDSGYVQVN